MPGPVLSTSAGHLARDLLRGRVNLWIWQIGPEMTGKTDFFSPLAQRKREMLEFTSI